MTPSCPYLGVLTQFFVGWNIIRQHCLNGAVWFVKNQEYLAARISSACHDVQYPAGAKICKENTADLENYMHHVLKSDTSPETMCKIIGMCNNMKLDNIISINVSTYVHTYIPIKVFLSNLGMFITCQMAL